MARRGMHSACRGPSSMACPSFDRPRQHADETVDRLLAMVGPVGRGPAYDFRLTDGEFNAPMLPVELSPVSRKCCHGSLSMADRRD